MSVACDWVTAHGASDESTVMPFPFVEAFSADPVRLVAVQLVPLHPCGGASRVIPSGGRRADHTRRRLRRQQLPRLGRGGRRAGARQARGLWRWKGRGGVIVVLATGIHASCVRVVDAQTDRTTVALLRHGPALVLVLLLCRGEKRQLDKLDAR